MKRVIIICGLLLGIVTFANAQQGQVRGRMGGTPEERAKRSTEMLSDRLKLTEDQKSKVNAIYLEQGTKMRKMRDSLGGNNNGNQSMMSAMRKHNEESEAKIETLLTADQKKLFAEWKEQRAERMKKRQEGGQR